MATGLVLCVLLAAAPREAVYEYDVTVDGSAGELSIEARIDDASGGCFEVGEGLERHVVGVQARQRGRWREVARTNRCFDAPRGRPLEFRYRFALAEAAGSVAADRRRARVYEDAGGFFVPPTAWLLRPAAFAHGRYRLHVRTPPGLHFVTGLPRVAPATYEGRVEFLDGLPYAVLTRHEPSTLAVNGGEIEWAVLPTETPMPTDALERWIERSAAAVTGYLGTFPVPRVAVIVSSRGGSTMGFGGAAIRVGAPRNAAADWLLVHEMIHLALPNLGPDDRWLEEGLATYVEPIARQRAGHMSAAEVWGRFVRAMPQGLVRSEMGPTPAGAPSEWRRRWARTYWGGALYWLAADVALLERTEGRVGVGDVLAVVRAAGGDIRVRWDLARLFDVARTAAGTDVLGELHAKPMPIADAAELEALWTKLGVRCPASGDCTFDDSAALAWIRRRIDGDRIAIPPPAAPPTPEPAARK